MVDVFLFLKNCCSFRINQRLVAPQHCIIYAGVFEVYSAFSLIDVSGKCIIRDDLFFPWQPLIIGGSITNKFRHITASHTIIKWEEVKYRLALGITINYLGVNINSLGINTNSHLCSKRFLVPLSVLLSIIVPFPPIMIFLLWMWRHMVFGVDAGLFDASICCCGGFIGS